MEAKEARAKYGTSGVPLKATRIWRRPIEHFQEKLKIDGMSWILVDDQAQTVTYANSYSGRAGKKFVARPIALNEEKLQKKLAKGWIKTDATACPLVN